MAPDTKRTQSVTRIEDVAGVSHEGRMAELRPGRLFIHDALADAHTGGPLYCRLIGLTEGRVVYQMINRPPDGPRRDGESWRMPVNYFFESCLGEWYDEADEPPAPVPRQRPGLLPPLPPRKPGPSGPGH